MNEKDLLLAAEVHAIVGCAFDVMNEVGHGLHEKIYENALAVEFRCRNIEFAQQPEFPVCYKETVVGKFIPDLICFGTVVVDTKTVEEITNHERGQMLTYLRITRLQVGVILNFKRRKLEWERIVLSGR